MRSWFFVSDLHGRITRFKSLFSAIRQHRPEAVFIAGDILPHLFASLSDAGITSAHNDFLSDFLLIELDSLRSDLQSNYPDIFLILGNDDPRIEEPGIIHAATQGFFHYCHYRKLDFKGYQIIGYSYVPPTPFLLKDWERYDVSTYVDPGCIHPDEGRRSAPIPIEESHTSTIHEDLNALTDSSPLDQTICLFHTPPHQTFLDRAALDGKMIDYVPLDVHIGSIAVRRFIEARQPLLTLHGHVHESTRITGNWREQIGNTWCFQGAHDGPELSIIRFHPSDPSEADRMVI